jgi:DNA-binding FadR family transcriptional regulator
MPSPRKPRYSVIADDFARAIERGQYPVGTLLPSEAELRAKYEVSHHTVRDALRPQGVEPVLLSPDQSQDKVRSEIELWAPVIVKSGMKGSL